MFRFSSIIHSLPAILLLCSTVLFGQGTDLGVIRGTVTDASGATVPNATVTITDTGTNSQRTVRTNNAGEYEANSLKSGSYTISIAAAGFSTRSEERRVG